MKVVHEIHSDKIQIVLSPSAYVSAEGRLHRMQLIVCATIPLPPGDEVEALHLEGDGGHIVSVLRQIADLIEVTGRDMVRDGRLDPSWNS